MEIAWSSIVASAANDDDDEVEVLKKGSKTPNGQPEENDGGESSSDPHPEDNQIFGAGLDEQEDEEGEEEELQAQPDDPVDLGMDGSDDDEMKTQPAAPDDIAKSLLFNGDGDDDSKVELAAQIHIPIPIAKNSKSGEIVFNISGLHPWRQLVWQLRISWLMPCWL